jgi:hypothetical protein
MMLNVSGTENDHNHLQNGAVGPRKRQTNIERAILPSNIDGNSMAEHVLSFPAYELPLEINLQNTSTHDMTSDHFS